MKTISFNDTLKALLFRVGREEEDPQVANYPDQSSMLNLRLQECWEFTFWDFLKVTAKHEFPTEGALIETELSTGGVDTDFIQIETSGQSETNTLAYKFIKVDDEKTVLGVYASDPREVENAVELRSHFTESGRLRLEAGTPDVVWYTYIPYRPDWLADDPAPEVYDCFRQAAVELTAADVWGQDESGTKRAQQAEARGYALLDKLASRYALMHKQPSLQVRTARRC